MLVAIKTKRISKISTLNRKGEKIILNIPAAEWVVIESISNPGLLLNSEQIIAEGGQVYSSLWRSDPPFGEKSVKFMRDGFTTTIDATMIEMRTVSDDAILELSKEAADSYDTILQDSEISEYIDSVEALTEKITDVIAGLKSAYVSNKISEEEYKIKSIEAFDSYMSTVTVNASNYFLDVFGIDTNDAQARKILSSRT